jgi:hypothetical protein
MSYEDDVRKRINAIKEEKTMPSNVSIPEGRRKKLAERTRTMLKQKGLSQGNLSTIMSNTAGEGLSKKDSRLKYQGVVSKVTRDKNFGPENAAKLETALDTLDGLLPGGTMNGPVTDDEAETLRALLVEAEKERDEAIALKESLALEREMLVGKLREKQEVDRISLVVQVLDLSADDEKIMRRILGE